MTFLKKLDEDAKVFDVFGAWPEIYGPWERVSQVLLREAPSRLSEGQRELIGAFVSRRNQCQYCYEVHNSATRAYGYAGELVEQLNDDIELADVDDDLKPILRYVRKLNDEQYKMVQGDVDQVLSAGWDEDDLHLAVAICGLFNFMNRLVHGLGVEEDPAYSLAAGPRLREMGYDGSSKLPKAQRDNYTAPPA